jgi:hypothetical protein
MAAFNTLKNKSILSRAFASSSGEIEGTLSMGFNYYGIFQGALFGWNFFAEINESFDISLNGLFGHLDSLFYRLSKSMAASLKPEINH